MVIINEGKKRNLDICWYEADVAKGEWLEKDTTARWRLPETSTKTAKVRKVNGSHPVLFFGYPILYCTRARPIFFNTQNNITQYKIRDLTRQ